MVVKITTFIVDVVGYDPIEQVSINQTECISILQDVTTSDKALRFLKRRETIVMW